MTTATATAGMKPRAKRNSSVELLRILAMFLITVYHYVMFYDYTVKPTELPFSASQLVYTIWANSGKVGVCIFFFISAWYICQDKNPTFRKGLRKAWIFQREVLFYSLALLIGTWLFMPWHFDIGTFWAYLLPIPKNTWWFATAYFVFLVLSPCLTVGLRRMGKKMHGAMALSMFVMWGLCYGLLPDDTVLSFASGGILEFIFLYTVMSYYRWYMKELTGKQSMAVFGAGLGLLAVYITAGNLLFARFGMFHSLITIGQGGPKLPMILIAFGLVAYANTKEFHSRVVNRIAQSTFAVYLLTLSGTGYFIIVDYFNFGSYYRNPYAVFIELGITLAAYVICTVIDFVRQGLFAVTIDRHPGRMFDRLWQWGAEHVSPSFTRLLAKWEREDVPASPAPAQVSPLADVTLTD